MLPLHHTRLRIVHGSRCFVEVELAVEAYMGSVLCVWERGLVECRRVPRFALTLWGPCVLEWVLKLLRRNV